MEEIKTEYKRLEVLGDNQKCVFCLQKDVDEIKYGPVYMLDNIITHYYCMLLSPKLIQNGSDSDGILGFLPKDIQKELNRGCRLTCTFCKLKHATLGCAIAKCKVKFHLPCGMKNGTLHQFIGNFNSYCAKHRPVQRIGEDVLAEATNRELCYVCYEKVVPPFIGNILWTPCCEKFFHQDCLQKFALSAGNEHFRCPICGDRSTREFQYEMKMFGIFIPEQDASWELEPNAYEELYKIPDTCNSKTCSCPSGRQSNSPDTKWELILCNFCGSQGIHIGCKVVNTSDKYNNSAEFVCDICSTNDTLESEEASPRNYNGNQNGSWSEKLDKLHHSILVNREGEEAQDDTSDKITKVTLAKRGKSWKVINPSAPETTNTTSTSNHHCQHQDPPPTTTASDTDTGNAPEKVTSTVDIEESDTDLETAEDAEIVDEGTLDAMTEPKTQHTPDRSYAEPLLEAANWQPKNPLELQEAESQTSDTFTSNNIITRTNEQEEECDLYCKMLAKKLKRLPEDERELVMYKIDGIFINRRQSINPQTETNHLPVNNYPS